MNMSVDIDNDGGNLPESHDNHNDHQYHEHNHNDQAEREHHLGVRGDRGQCPVAL